MKQHPKHVTTGSHSHSRTGEHIIRTTRRCLSNKFSINQCIRPICTRTHKHCHTLYSPVFIHLSDWLFTHEQDQIHLRHTYPHSPDFPSSLQLLQHRKARCGGLTITRADGLAVDETSVFLRLNSSWHKRPRWLGWSLVPGNKLSIIRLCTWALSFELNYLIPISNVHSPRTTIPPSSIHTHIMLSWMPQQ